MNADTLVNEKYCYITSKESSSEVFEEIGKILFEEGLVTEEFSEQIKIREKDFPTALDISPIFSDVSGIAIPHTESEYVKTQKVIPIKLNVPFKMRNMIDPSSEVEVNFMFMILNNDSSGQSNILAKIMSGITSSDKKVLKEIADINNSNDVCKFAKKVLESGEND